MKGQIVCTVTLDMHRQLRALRRKRCPCFVPAASAQCQVVHLLGGSGDSGSVRLNVSNAVASLPFSP